MRKLPLALLFSLMLFVGLHQSYAQQQGFCGTEVTPAVRAWLDARVIPQQALNKTASTLYTPVQLHLVGTDNGLGYLAKEDAYALICELNVRFAPMNMKFYLSGPIHHIDSTVYYNHSLPYGYQMMNLYNVPNVCNVYVTNFAAGTCGYAFFPLSGPDQGRGGIALKKSCALPGNNTLAHEMGHYFSLPHTFDQWNTSNAELVNGSNCATAGDKFCDTNADYLDYRWNCPFSGFKLDANGDQYQPDGSLYMSYSIEPCANRFSPLQQSTIVNSRIVDRAYLDTSAIPTFAAPQPVSLMSPMDSAMTVPTTNALFSWHPLSGAIDYRLIIKKASTGSFVNGVIDSYTVGDTLAYVTGLTDDTMYHWKVIPVMRDNPCTQLDSGLAQIRVFTASALAVAIRESLESGISLELFPNPFNGDSFKLKVNATSGTEATVQCYDLMGRLVQERKEYLKSGVNLLEMTIPSLQKGIYFIRVSDGADQLVRPIIKN